MNTYPFPPIESHFLWLFDVWGLLIMACIGMAPAKKPENPACREK